MRMNTKSIITMRMSMKSIITMRMSMKNIITMRMSTKNIITMTTIIITTTMRERPRNMVSVPLYITAASHLI